MKFPRPSRACLFAVVLCALPSLSFAFAENNVRKDHFHWEVAKTEHFDIYYDKKEEALVPRMAQYLEQAWKEVGDKINFKVTERTPFFIYSNHNQFEQTNIVPIGEGTGGVTEAFKNRLVIFNDGSQTWLKHVIPHEFTHVTQFNVLYGGWWKSVRLLKSPFYPLWFMEGMAEYGGGDLDEPTGDMVVRDAVFTHTLIGLPELQGFNHLKPNQVTLGYKTGEKAMDFLADEYGKDKIGKLLVEMESHFDVSSTLTDLLGTDLLRFDLRFQEWLYEKYADFFSRAKSPDFYGPKLTKPDELPQFNEGPAVSPDGKKIYYFGDRHGPTRIFELDLATQKTKLLIDIQYTKFEYLHPEGRSMSVSSDGRWLAFSSEKIQSDFLYLFDLKKKKLKKIQIPFDQIRSPVFSPVDDSLVCVGMMNGFNDLYQISPDGQIIKRLTNNPQDERDPTFTPDGKQIVYSGEMMLADDSGPNGRDLFRLDLQSLSIEHITSLIGEEREPEVLPDGSILFVRDMNSKGEYGFNLYKMKTDGSVEQLTDMVGGAFAPRYSAATNSLYYVGFFRGEKHIYQFTAPVMTAQKSETVASQKSSSKTTTVLGEGEAALNLKQKDLTQSLNTWPEGAASPLITGAAKPYRLKGSTDIFLPFFFYSSLDGFVLADYWQVSDMLGDHIFQQQLQYASGSNLHDLVMYYTYAKFRPQFTLGFRSTQFYRDFDEQDRRRVESGVGLVTYPLDRTNSIQAGVGVNDQKDTYLDQSSPNQYLMDRFFLASFIHDTVTGRYLVPTQGNRLGLFYQQGTGEFKGNQLYKAGGIDAAQYFMLPKESTLATRMFYARSLGRDPQDFRLGGIDRIRGVSSGSIENKKTNILIAGAEARIKLSYLNARTKFLYPDFFFKAAYLIMFDDIGYGWDNGAERDAFDFSQTSNSAGIGISWPTFILQSFKLDFTILYSKRTDTGADIWFITVGPTF